MEDVTDEMTGAAPDRRMRALWEATSDYVLVTDDERRLVYVNAAARDRLDLPVDLIGSRVLLEDLYAASSRPRLRALLSSAAEHGSDRADLVLGTPTGDEVPVSQVTVAHAPQTGSDDETGVPCFATVARDITVEKSTERELLLRSTKLGSIIELAADLVIVLDDRGIVTDVGESLRDLVGVDPDEWVGRPLADLVEPEDHDAVERAVTATRALGADGFESGLFRVPRDGESVVWIQTRMANLLDDEAVGGIVAVVWDETERATVTEALRESEEKFRSLAASSPLGILHTGPNHEVVYANPRLREIFGVTSDEMLGPRLVHPDDRARVFDQMREALTEGGVACCEYRVVRSDGDVRHVRVSAATLDDGLGGVAGSVASFEDVTADAVARVRVQRLAALLESTPDVAFISDRLGRVLFANEPATTLLGITEGTDVSVAALSAFDESSRDLLRREVLPGVRRDGLWTGELTIVDPDGAPIPVSVVTIAHRDDTGAIDFVSTIARDIASLKEAEARLVESESWLRSLVSHAIDIVTVSDADGRMVFVSPSIEEVLGYDADALVRGDGALPEVHPDDLDAVVARHEEVRSAPGAVIRCVYRVRHHDGQWRWIESRLTNLLDDASVRGVVTNAHDVTDRRTAEDARARVDSTLLALVDASPLAIVVIEEDGSIQLWNRASEALFGWSAEDVLGRSLPIVPADDEASAVELTARVFAGESLTGLERRRTRRDGSPVDVSLSAGPVRDRAGQVVSAILVYADITARQQAEGALRSSEERFKALVENLSDVVTIVDEHGQIVQTSPAANRIFGFEDHDLSWTDPLSTIHPDDADEMARRMNAQIADGGSEPIPFRVRSTEGSWRHVESIAKNLLDDPSVEGIVITTRDVTDRRRAETLVVAQAAVLEMVARGTALPETLAAVCRLVEDNVEGASCSVMIAEPTRRRLVLTAAPNLPPALTKALRGGLAIGEGNGVCGTAAARGAEVYAGDVADDLHSPAFRAALAEAELSGCWAVPILASADDRVLGTFAVYWAHDRPPTDDDRRVLDALVNLASIAIERNTSEQQLEHQAYHDPLTGLPNRTLFVEFLTVALARARRRRTATAVLFLDLDRFKVFNDSLGHDHGDELLVAVARRLREALRPGDTIARFGGDEFTVLCDDLSGPDARQHAIDVAERILDKLSAPFVLNGAHQFLTASIGIALATGGYEIPEDLLRDADAAMYRAKDHGKARWELFDEGMRARARERLETESAMHRALERGEFRVYYQPIVSLTEVRYVGVEALLRWQHPERGIIAPGDFVALAEETGLIVPLGAWVLSEVARQHRLWSENPRVDPSLVVSVNLSAKQISHPEIVETVARVLDRGELRPENLCLEITESVLLDDAGAALKTLTGFKELGVALSMDDFGTGYSSLGYLKRFPIDSVKVDRSFVDGLGHDPEDSAIVAGVVGLGRALGLTVVGEGVESEEQLGALVSLGCHQAQGFFFSPPRVPEEIEPLLAGHGPTLRLPGAAATGGESGRSRRGGHGPRPT
ncbi:MAG TPA: PAS domain S-box protein [Acidimicrobiia bacterium]|nr:PAS domain S-box protein [Acidimicrobiia bacterium]